MHTAANFPNALGAGTRNLPIENAGIRAGEIIAFRCWILTKQEVVEGRYRLCSTYANCVWEPNKVVGLMPEADPDWPAIARENPAEVIAHQFKERKKIDPHDRLGVRVGIHAFKNAGYMMTEFAPSHDPSLDRYLVYGTVALWGDVIEHRHGFRAEYAKINTLDAIDSGFRDDILDKLRHIYGVEGKSYRDFKIGVKP